MKRLNFENIKGHFDFSDKLFRRRFIIRLCAVVFIILLGIVMYFIGKNHTVNLSNMKVEIDGTTYKGIDDLVVRFDKNEEFTSYADFSDEVSAVGQHHTLEVEYNGDVYRKKFKIPTSYRNVIISLPVFIKDTDNIKAWLTEVKTESTTATDISSEENTETSEFGM